MTVTINGTTGVSLADTNSVPTAAIQNSAVTIAKISATGTASSSTFLRGDGAWSSATPSTTDVLTATAGASVGDVGTYAFLYISASNTGAAAGSTRAGSGLVYTFVLVSTSSGSAWSTGGSGSPAGTWRCMGYAAAYANSNMRGATLWLRIS